VALSKQNRLASLNNTGFTVNEKSQDRNSAEPDWNIAKDIQDNPNRITALDKLISPQYKTFQMKKKREGGVLHSLALGNKPVQEYYTVKPLNVQLYEKFVENSRRVSCVTLKFKISPEKSTSLSRTA
jgi:hypothetical protein